MPRRVFVVAALVGVLLAGTATVASAASVRLNEIQVIGTHNSYHVEPSTAEKQLRAGSGLVNEAELEYSHAPLRWQLARQDVRQFELDVWADPAGGLYAAPQLRTLAGHPAYDPEMGLPGTKVLHVQDYDYRATCLTLVACLREIEAWSDANPRHVPITIQLEFKDGPISGVPAVVPLPWTGERMDAVDAEIRSVFARRDVITPDDVRGRRTTLEEAVLRDGWPRLAQARGKVLFTMDNGEPYRSRYLEGHPSLGGRVLFTNSTPGQPDAAFIKENEVLRDFARIRDEVRRGYIVRTRADLPTVEARNEDPRRRDQALASGAHFVSTDFPAPGMAARFGSGYVVQLPGELPARCNPINAPAGCRDDRLEPPRA